MAHIAASSDDAERSGDDGRRGERTSESTRERLVSAALGVFVRKGYDDTRVEDLCQAAGSARATFYRHFSGKDEVFLALVERLMSEVDDMAASVAPVTPDVAGYDTLRALVGRNLSIALRWGPVIDVLSLRAKDNSPARQRATASMVEANRAIGRSLSRGGAGGDDPATAAMALTAIVEGVAHQLRTWDIAFSRDEVVDGVAYLALRMVHGDVLDQDPLLAV